MALVITEPTPDDGVASLCCLSVSQLGQQPLCVTSVSTTLAASQTGCRLWLPRATWPDEQSLFFATSELTSSPKWELPFVLVFGP